MLSDIGLKGGMKKLDLFQDQLNNSDFLQTQKSKYEKNNLSFQHKTHDDKILKENECKIFILDIKEIYEQEIPIKIKGYDREEYSTNLTIKIMWNTPSNQHASLLHIEITDTTNNQFLYILDLPESDFIKLKNEQHLLVDYQMFPKKLVEIIELCQCPQDNVSFACILDHKNKNEAILQIVELNQFKMLQHLAMTFKMATDENIKKYLSHKLQISNNQILQQTKQIENLTLKLHEKTSENEILLQNVNYIKDEKDKMIDNLLQKEREKMTDILQNNLKKEETQYRTYNSEKEQLVNKYENQIENLLIKNEDYQDQILILQKNKLNIESDLSQKTQNLILIQKDLDFYKSHNDQSRCQNQEQNQKIMDLEKQQQQLLLSNQSLKQQLDDKSQIDLKNKDIIQQGQQQNSLLNENLIQYKKQVEKLEMKLKLCMEEINKGNEVIERLQNQNESKKSKLKQKNNLILQQEDSMAKLKDIIQDFKKNENQYGRIQDEKDLKIKELEIQVKDQKQKLEESLNLIESNNQMIQYLNKQLNESQKPSFTSNIQKTTIPSYNTNYNYVSYDKPSEKQFSNFGDQSPVSHMQYTPINQSYKEKSYISDKKDDLDSYLKPRDIQPIKYKAIQKID